MIIDTFDLSGAYLAARYEDADEWDVSQDALYQVAMRQLLICPDQAQAGNRLPYLQDHDNPCIVDFFDAQGKLNFDAAKWLPDILANLEKPDSALSNYFHAQLAVLEDCQSYPADWNVIVVPDSYEVIKQEYLLRRCELPRTKTRLLWRSVSICLGAMDELLSAGAAKGDDVAIVDVLDEGYTISILQLNNDGGEIVPQRKRFRGYCPIMLDRKRVFRNRQSAYFERMDENYGENWTCYSEEGNEFYKHSYHRGKEQAIVYEAGRFVQKDCFCYDLLPFKLEDWMLQRAKFCILRGISDERLINKSHLKSSHVIIAPDHVSNLGAARFALRSTNGKSTYFDECDALHIILQDVKRQEVNAVTLIKSSTTCRGGETIIGETFTNSKLETESQEVCFYLLAGDIDRKAALKELTHKFEQITKDVQPLILNPSMIAGQGVAIVEVDAYPLIENRVKLELLEMKDSTETMDSLFEKMDLAYPIDFPEVEASAELWEKVEREVERYIKHDEIPDSDIFAKAQPKNRLATGLDKLARFNVFGTSSRPVGDDVINVLFKKLLKDYHKYKRNDDKNKLEQIVRIAAWTYQSEHSDIKEIALSCLENIEYSAKDGPKLRPQYHTLMACCLPTHDARQRYINAFLLRARKQMDTAGITGLVHHAPYLQSSLQGKKNTPEITNVFTWLTALSKMFMNNNDLMQSLSPHECVLLAETLIIILASARANSKGESSINSTTKCLIYVLKRRRYDSDFMSLATHHFKALNNLLNDESWSRRPLENELLNLLNGKGSILGLPALLEGENK